MFTELMIKFRHFKLKNLRNKPLLMSVTLLLVLLAVASVTGIYFLDKYFYPPVQIIRGSDIANSVVFITSKGNIEIKVDPRSRFAASQFTRLVRSGFYDETKFHRIVHNLLIEGGDPLTKSDNLVNFWGQGGLGNAFKNDVHFGDKMTAGTVAFSSSGAETYGSQFFILTKDTPWLDGKHTIIGHVVSGMDVVLKIEDSSVDSKGTPNDLVTISSIVEK